MYKVTCKNNGRVYIGYTNSMKRRICQHSSKPPRRMRADVQRLGGFRNNFEVETLTAQSTEQTAKAMEQTYIERLGTRGPAGYNVLESSPGRSRLYWWMKRRQSSKK